MLSYHVGGTRQSSPLVLGRLPRVTRSSTDEKSKSDHSNVMGNQKGRQVFEPEEWCLHLLH